MTRPDPREHAGQIVAWAICWPWNLLWTLVVYNPLRYVLRFLFHEIRSTLDEIATGEFSDIERELNENEFAETDRRVAPLVAQPNLPTESCVRTEIPAASAEPPEYSVVAQARGVSMMRAAEEAGGDGEQANEPDAGFEAIVRAGVSAGSATNRPELENSSGNSMSEPIGADTCREGSDESASQASQLPGSMPETASSSPENDPWFYMPISRHQESHATGARRPSDSDNTASLN